MSDASTLTVLHGLRLGSVVDTDPLAARTGLGIGQLSELLDALVVRGWVRRTDGRLPGWSLTRSGRVEGERLLSVELDRTGSRPAIEAAHRAFLPLNDRVLAACTDWQVVVRSGSPVANDHADDGHDVAVLERLGRLHAEVRPVLRRLSAALDRFGGYQPRLDRALRLTIEGHAEWFTRPSIDSYHTVWFELHEDLLATLGRRRAEDRSTRARGVVTGAGSASVDDAAAVDRAARRADDSAASRAHQEHA